MISMGRDRCYCSAGSGMVLVWPVAVPGDLSWSGLHNV